MRVLEVIGKVSRCGIKNICITGGEPLLEEDFYQLEEWLFKAGYNTVVETNGSISIENIKSQVAMDIKPPSSGMAEQFLRENLDRLKPNDQVKFIIQDIKDYDYAKEMLKDIKQGKVIFMPVWDEKFKAAKDLARWIMADRLSVRLSLQMHKILHLK
jgi:7-carboxy-7-deazaguanine synthase